MPRIKLTEEQLKELEEKHDLVAFEKYCGSCDNYGTSDCPFLSEATELSEWKKLGCDKFWD